MSRLVRRIHAQEQRVRVSQANWCDSWNNTQAAIKARLGSPLGLLGGFGVGYWLAGRRPVARRSDGPSLLRMLLPWATMFLQGLQLGREAEDDDGD